MDKSGEQNDSDVEEFPLSIESNISSLVYTAAFPVSAEFEYLYETGIPYKLLNPKAIESLARDPKAFNTAKKLREKIAATGRIRKFHNLEVHRILDLDLREEYDAILEIQKPHPPPSLFPKEPAESWEKLSDGVYKDVKTETYYWRSKISGEFRVSIPKLRVVVEFRDNDIIKGMTQKVPKTIVPNLDNSAFRLLYDKAKKNLEEAGTSEIQTTPSLPLSAFIEETSIQRAVRLSKEKYLKISEQKVKNGEGKGRKRKKMDEPSHLSTSVEDTSLERTNRLAKEKHRKISEGKVKNDEANEIKRKKLDNYSSSSPHSTTYVEETSDEETSIERTIRLAKEKKRKSIEGKVKRGERNEVKMKKLNNHSSSPPHPATFVEETSIERAIRLAKEKNRKSIEGKVKKGEGNEVKMKKLDNHLSSPRHPATFVEETSIERAIRLAKEKNRKSSEGKVKNGEGNEIIGKKLDNHSSLPSHPVTFLKETPIERAIRLAKEKHHKSSDEKVKNGEENEIKGKKLDNYSSSPLPHFATSVKETIIERAIRLAKEKYRKIDEESAKIVEVKGKKDKKNDESERVNQKIKIFPPAPNLSSDESETSPSRSPIGTFGSPIETDKLSSRSAPTPALPNFEEDGDILQIGIEDDDDWLI